MKNGYVNSRRCTQVLQQPNTVPCNLDLVPPCRVLAFRVSPFSATGSRPSYQDKDKDEQGRGNMRPLVGRDTEMAMVLNKAANMISGLDTGGVIVIEGNTGGYRQRNYSRLLHSPLLRQIGSLAEREFRILLVHQL